MLSFMSKIFSTTFLIFVLVLSSEPDEYTICYWCYLQPDGSKLCSRPEHYPLVTDISVTKNYYYLDCGEDLLVIPSNGCGVTCRRIGRCSETERNTGKNLRLVAYFFI